MKLWANRSGALRLAENKIVVFWGETVWFFFIYAWEYRRY